MYCHLFFLLSEFLTSILRYASRLELEEREAALPKRQSKDLKLRLCKYMDWLTLCDSKKAERTGVLGELGVFQRFGG